MKILRIIRRFLDAEINEVKELFRPFPPEVQICEEEATSDFGRRYGWLVEKEGEVVAQLDYIRHDVDSQFWHQYELRDLRPDMKELAFDSNAWINHEITLRNVKFTDVLISHALISVHEDGVIAVRSAYVPEADFQ